MSVKFNGLLETAATFSAASQITKGTPVSVSSNGTVAAAATSTAFCGVANHYAKGLQSVQIRGFVEVPYTATAPTVGYSFLAANGSGGVKVDATNGRAYLVLTVNTTAHTVGFIL